MKLKSLPEDFQVDELSEFVPDGGPFAVYRLTKRGLGTPEVLDAVAKRWRIRRGQISCGGLKDRHAVTTQWITIERGPRRTLEQTHFKLAYQGQASRPFASGDITGNRFCITLRDVDRDAIDRARQAVDRIRHDGLPNYFDQQRFGSVGQSGEFIVRAWCEGDYERAMWLALADPNPHDRPEDRAERRLVREHWGQWDRCRKKLRRWPWREVASHLALHPGDFRGASEVLRGDLRSLWAAAFQSYLWNRMLARLLRDRCRAGQLAEVAIGRWTLPFPRELDAQDREWLARWRLPLPTARTRLEEGPVKQLADRVLAAEGLEWSRLRLKYPRRTFFSKGDRAALIVAEGLEIQWRADELAPGRQAMVLRFDLPRGSYATLLTKRLFVA